MFAAHEEAARTPEVSAIEAAIQTLARHGLKFLSDMEREVVGCFRGWEIVPASEISQRTHYPNTPHFRAILTNLAERGVLRATSRGYHLGT